MAFWKPTAKRTSVFKHKPMTCTQGHSHRSKLEGSVCAMLQLRVRAKEVLKVEPEQHIKICGPIGHECSSKTKIESVVDFKLTMADGSIRYVEAKGYANEKWPMKKRLWEHNNIGVLEIWMGTAQHPFLAEVIGD